MNTSLPMFRVLRLLRPLPSRLLALGVVALAVAAPKAEARVAAQAVQTDVEHGFHYRVPPGWFLVQQEAVSALDAFVSAQLGEKKDFTFFLAFAKNEDGEMKVPYVLFQYQAQGMGNGTEEDVRQAFGVIDEAAAEVTKNIDVLEDATVQKPVFDLERRRVILHGTSVVDGMNLRSQSVVLLGRDRALTFHCYGEESNFKALLPECNAWAEQTALAPEHVWEPGSSGGALSRILTGTWRGALIGGLIGLASAIFGVVRRRRKQAS